ncbi:endonuclease III [Fulvivirgaceae bacterium BMA10]|uniref:Endonuclease III n=1 Tax=Splendidivirga corallicola TaxID=3051826 RepID=A0ABT8KSC2_9BACT|nr:endonuclease III [Fulvivirgaceae bacterium BMA10]
MNKSEKAGFVVQKLEEIYPDVPIPLDHHSPYTLLVAVLLSAQCTDERVNKITPALFVEADNAFDMAQVPVEEIKEIIRPCGLSPMKSKSISELSRILVDKYNGEVPDNMEALEALPGVGHKTASVVMSQAFGVPSFPVDTHIHRLIYRWGLSNGKNVQQTEKDCKRLFNEALWNKLHLQIIFFGRQYCPARGHNPHECPICSRIGRKPMFRNFDLKPANK